MNPERPFAPRLSIPVEYHRCEPAEAQRDDMVPRETCGSSDPGPLDLYGLANAGESTDPDLLRAAGLAGIIWPDGKNDQALGNAISSLQKALRLSTHRVPLLVDLSAAHTVRGEREQNPRDLLAAIDYADEAVELEPRNLEARYNAALARQAFGLDEEAERAWDAYLELDSASGWAEEARARKRGLITRPRAIPRPGPDASAAEADTFARYYPQEAREYGWHDVLRRWGAAMETGDAAQAASLLELAEKLGRALQARPGGDASLADAVDAIRTAEPDREVRALARAHREYAVATAYFDAVETDSAVEALARIAEVQPPSPVLLQWAAVIRAGTRWYLRQPHEANADLHALLARVDISRHPALAGRVQLMLGTMQLKGGHHTAARKQLTLAGRHLRNAGETELYGAALAGEGEAAYEEGDTIAAYQALYRAQQALRPYRQSGRLHNHLHGLARCAALDGMSRAAVSILDEDLRVARREGTGVRVVDVFQFRSRTRAGLGDAAGAASDWDSASVRALQLPDDAVQRKWAMAAIQLANPEKVSAAAMDTAVDYLSANQLWRSADLLRRADSRIADGDLAGASRDLEAVTASVQAVLSTDASRGATLEQARGWFDRLVMLYLRMDRPVEALRTLDRGRLSFAPRRDGAPPAGDGRLAAPPGHVALEYALIGDTLLTWVLRGETLRVVRRNIDRDAFILAVEQVGAALESTDAPIPRRALRRLYDLLVRPVRGDLGPADTPLVILADGEVAGVPFAALLDGRRYLVQDHPLRYAATLADAARQEPPRARTGPALLVADPAFDQGAYPMLYPLDWARREVDSLLPLYPDRMLLRGDGATRGTFISGAQSASVIHYAGHAVFDDARPEHSYLVLAGRDTTGRLTAGTVRGLRLRGVRLVVLSACRTLRAREGRSGGFAGLSGALLMAEAGGVVGSLWQVSDELTAPLMREFHARFQKSGDPALALREAQLEMLRSSKDRRLNSPAAWAGFRYTGAQRP